LRGRRCRYKTVPKEHNTMITTRRRWHISALAAAAFIVAACGGGSNTDSPLASRVVVFGDSLSDVGTYTSATSLTTTPGAAPYFGGKFTTNTFAEYALAPAGTARAPNTSTASTWVEWISARLGVPLTTAMAGFGPDTPQTRVRCPVTRTAPALAGSCTGYAQGGSRVTSPAGIGNPNGNGGSSASPAPITLPMVTQVADHLAAFTSFSSDDIVFVFGGNNDVFVQFGAVGQGLPVDQAQANIVTAATELVTLVKNEIIAKGGKRVAVMTLPDSALTPFGSTLSADGQALLSGLSAAFNTALLAGLDGSGAKIIDARALNAAVRAAPSSFGLTNITVPACDAAKISAISGSRITDGSSLFCNASKDVPFNGIRAGASASTYLFADGVHPTTAGHKIFADQVWTKLKDFGWAPDNL
jgi:outer membrane lipase/esterase